MPPSTPSARRRRPRRRGAGLFRRRPIHPPSADPAAPRPAILLLGPTGSGKTPLGRLLEREGLQGRRCIHVDFGLLLRRASAGWTAPGLLTRPERRVIDAVLRTGALLDDAHFPLARKLLREALARRPAQPPPCLVLNGLPRHAGQARAIEADAKVLAVAHLACAPSVAWRRIRTDAGGDRAGRRDDLPQAVRRRLALYRRRTAPLLAYYRARGVPIIRIAVEPDLSAHRMRDRLIRGLRRNRRWNRGLASDPDLCYE